MDLTATNDANVEGIDLMDEDKDDTDMMSGGVGDIELAQQALKSSSGSWVDNSGLERWLSKPSSESNSWVGNSNGVDDIGDIEVVRQALKLSCASYAQVAMCIS